MYKAFILLLVTLGTTSVTAQPPGPPVSEPVDANVLNFPEVQTVNGSVSVSNFPDRIPHRDRVQDLVSGNRINCRFEVPVGKRLVIEVLGARFNASGIGYSFLDTALLVDGGLNNHRDYPLGFISLSGDALIIRADGPFYADDTNNQPDGTDFQWALFALDGVDNSVANCSISGYLIPAPSM
jgi:hypothetical protein